MSEEKPAYGIRGGLAHEAGSGSYVLWDNTKCNPLAPAREQARSAWEDGYASAKREWVGLTEEEVDDIWNRYCDEMGEASINDAKDIARAIETALRSKNT